MYRNYLEDGEIKPEYTKTFISVFDGWLGVSNLYKLDEVTVDEWSRFNNLIRKIAQSYEIKKVDIDSESFISVTDIELLLSSHEEAMEKSSAEFTKIFIPDLDCIISEDWDYTYIVWCKDHESISKLKPLIDEIGLFSFQG